MIMVDITKLRINVQIIETNVHHTFKFDLKGRQTILLNEVMLRLNCKKIYKAASSIRLY